MSYEMADIEIPLWFVVRDTCPTPTVFEVCLRREEAEKYFMAARAAFPEGITIREGRGLIPAPSQKG